MAHVLSTNQHIMCNGPSPPLADIVFFGLSHSGFPSRFLKRVCEGEVSTPLQRMFHSPPQSMWDLTIHPLSGPSILAGTRSLLQEMWDPQSTPFGVQRLCWHTTSCPPPSELSLIAGTSPGVWLKYHCNGPSLPLANIVFFGLSLSGFPSRFLKCICLGEILHPYK